MTRYNTFVLTSRYTFMQAAYAPCSKLSLPHVSPKTPRTCCRHIEPVRGSHMVPCWPACPAKVRHPCSDKPPAKSTPVSLTSGPSNLNSTLCRMLHAKTQSSCSILSQCRCLQDFEAFFIIYPFRHFPVSCSKAPRLHYPDAR